jgi:hypothetical protein
MPDVRGLPRHAGPVADAQAAAAWQALPASERDGDRGAVSATVSASRDGRV